MANIKESMPPVIVSFPGFLSVDDTEPLNLPPDPNWTNTIHVECRLTLIDPGTGTYRVNVNGSSYSTINASGSFNPAQNTINIELDEVAPNSGTNFSCEFTYSAAQNTGTVDIDCVKSGNKVGKSKHKIAYGNE